MSSVTQYFIDNPRAMQEMSLDIKKWVSAASVKTVNGLAYKAQQNLRKAERQEFILRNKWTEKQTVYDKAPRKVYTNLEDIQATVGITEGASYMALQDEGGTRKPAKGPRLTIPTDAARGENKRKRVLSKWKDIGEAAVRGNYGHSSSRYAAAAYVAYKEDMLIHYGKDLFAVDKFSKPSRDRVDFYMTQIYERDFTEVKIDPKGFFLPAVEEAMADAWVDFNRNMEEMR